MKDTITAIYDLLQREYFDEGENAAIIFDARETITDAFNALTFEGTVETTVEELRGFIRDEIDTPEAYEISEYLEDESYYDDIAYDMSELDDILYGKTPSEIIRELDSDFDINDDMFKWTVWGLASLSEDDYIEEHEDDYKDWLINSGKTGNSDLDTLLEYEDELVDVFNILVREKKAEATE